jgi:hypothetical protein
VVRGRNSELDTVCVVWLADTKPLDIYIYAGGTLWHRWAGASSRLDGGNNAVSSRDASEENITFWPPCAESMEGFARLL